MPFKSALGNMPVIDDSNYQQFVTEPPGQSRGLIPRNYELIPYGSMPFAPAAEMDEIPRSEWKDRIEEAEKNKTRIVDLCDAVGSPVKNQASTNYCWINAVIRAMEIVRVIQNEPLIPLSSASIGCKIKNFKNQGGWGLEGVQYAVKHGAVPMSMWPNAAIDRKYDTPAANAERTKFKIIEWEDLPNTFEAVMTRVLRNIPCPVGYNWWGHEVCAVAGVVISADKYGIIIDNSWGNWGDRGRGVLNESKGRPDDAQSPRVGTPHSLATAL